VNGGERGIRTLGRALRPYGGLANRWFQPLTHLSVAWTRTARRRSGGIVFQFDGKSVVLFARCRSHIQKANVADSITAS
jgi:hypothetical protein